MNLDDEMRASKIRFYQTWTWVGRATLISIAIYVLLIPFAALKAAGDRANVTFQTIASEHDK